MASHLHDTLPFLLGRTAAIVGDEVDQTFRPVGLNGLSARVLVLLYLDDAHTVGELADKASLDQSTLSHILRRLETIGLVAKARPEHDSRTVLVSLTPDGQIAGEQCWDATQSHDALLRKGVSRSEIETLKTLLLKIYQNAPVFKRLQRQPAVVLPSVRSAPARRKPVSRRVHRERRPSGA